MDSKAWMWRALAVALLVPAVGACSAEDNDEANIDVETEAPPAAATPMTVAINPQGGSTITGEFTAMHEAENTRVRVNLSGLMEGKDYNATIRYGDCTVAMNYLTDDDADDAPAATPGTTPAPGTETAAEHEIGDEVADIDLNVTGATATGEADIDNDDLRADEPAFVMITEDAGMTDPDVLVGCADLRGHGGMGGTMPAPGATPGAEPGHAAPADTGRR